MEFILMIAQDLLHDLINYPFYSAAISIFLLGSLIHFYCKMTLGICDSHQDMNNKTVLITGASAGIGKMTAMDMARRNARVLLACRNVEKANKVAEEIKMATGNQNVFVKVLDLTSFASVRACAKSVLETEEKLHVLINNAGIAGIGKMTAMDMARRNARVLLACRNVEKANKVAEEIKMATGNQNVFVKVLDLTSFASVRACAKSVLETEEKLHVLINNAGIAGLKNRKLTADGCEHTMQSNHLGHFLLTLLLLDLLKRSSPSRIINVSSEAHRYQKLDIDDLSNNKGLHSTFVYGNTKLANILFTTELADKLQGSGVTVNSLHPGVVKTDFSFEDSFISALIKIAMFVTGKTAEEGAQTTIQLAVDPRLEKITGKYFADCKEKSVTRAARNKLLAKRLFEVSEKIVGESLCKK